MLPAYFFLVGYVAVLSLDMIFIKPLSRIEFFEKIFRMAFIVYGGVTFPTQLLCFDIKFFYWAVSIRLFIDAIYSITDLVSKAISQLVIRTETR
ncbi:hypothetical protein DSUL_20550 [Desulfovibrionales bacterium]